MTISDISNPEVRALAKVRAREKPDNRCMLGFEWIESPDGFIYWYNVYNGYETHLPPNLSPADRAKIDELLKKEI